jgi:hypothetical protein
MATAKEESPLSPASATPDETRQAALGVKPDPSAARPRRNAILMTPVSNALLFPDELRMLGDAVRESVAAQRIQPVDIATPEEVRRYQSLAAAGRFADDAPACALAPTAEEILRSHYPNAVEARLEVRCQPTGEGCQIKIELHDHGLIASTIVETESRGNVQEFTSAVRKARWEPRYLSLDSIDPVCTSCLPERPLRVDGLVLDGDWRTPPAAGDFAPEQGQLDACMSGVQRYIDAHALIQVSETGSVDRCEADPLLGVCVCTALQKHNFPQGAKDRRARIHMEHLPPAAPAGRKVKPAPPPISLDMDDWSAVSPVHPNEAALAKCLHLPIHRRRRKGRLIVPPADIPKSLNWELLEVFVQLDDTGKVSAVTPRMIGLTQGEKTCIQKEVSHLAFTCPGSAKHEAYYRYEVSEP